MKRIISFVIGFILLGLLCFGIYKFFFACEKTSTEFARNFILEGFDYAVIDDEAIVKLIAIDDNRCLEEDCIREGQLEVKLFVLNDMRLAYVTLGTLSESKKDIEKLGYSIELIDATTEKVTIKLNKLK